MRRKYMCIIQAGYFVKNGLIPSEINCQAIPTDTINVECWAIFDSNEIGNEYKCELKILLPNGKEFSFYTPLIEVKENQIFDSDNFETPIPTGIYSTAWFVIYNSNGNTICHSDGKGLNCENIKISEYISKADIRKRY